MTYIWEHEKWTDFRCQSELLLRHLGKARFCQDELLSKVRALGMNLSQEAQAEIMVEEAVKAAAIEGETFNRDSVRSSGGRKKGTGIFLHFLQKYNTNN